MLRHMIAMVLFCNLATSASAVSASHIYFVRHAETERNAGIAANDEAFSPKGWSQVAALKDQLGKMGVYFDRVVMSPMWRAKASVQPFLDGYSGSYDHGGVVYESGLSECCFSPDSSSTWGAKQAAEHVRQMISAAGRPLNILVVGHYFSGQHFLSDLVGQWTYPQAAQPMHFEIWR